jgi:RNA-binding protein YlmH
LVRTGDLLLIAGTGNARLLEKLPAGRAKNDEFHIQLFYQFHCI